MTRAVRTGFAVIVMVLLAAGLTSCATQTPLGTMQVHADSPAQPGALVATPDGMVWFANRDNGTIGRRSPDGTITSFPGAGAAMLAVGPDGNVWFTQQGGDQIGRITADGEISTFPSGLTSSFGVTTGPDGNLWYTGLTNSGQIVGIAKRTPAGVVTLYQGSTTLPGFPQDITTGPDGNLWYTTTSQRGLGNDTIARITPDGVATPFTTAGLDPGDITAGPDGNLWFTNAGGIGRITPAGAITLFPAVGASQVDLVTGPDGNLWFLGGQSIGRITTAGVVTRFPDPNIFNPGGLTSSPDGLWFTNNLGSGAIGHITTTGTITLGNPGANNPFAITKWLDGSVWFANRASSDGGIGRIAPGGTTQVFHNGDVEFPRGIAPSSDGSAWFTNPALNTIGHVSTAGAFTFFTDPKVQAPFGMTRGSDGNMWFTNSAGGSVGRITPDGAVTTYPTAFFLRPGILKPLDITTASDGGMWFDGDGIARVGRIDTTGAVQIFDLPFQPTAITTVDRDLWFTVYSQDLIGKVTPSGVVTTYTDPLIDSPSVLAADAAGNLYFANGSASSYGTGYGTGVSIGRRTRDGVVTLYPSNTAPQSMVGGLGDIYFTTGRANTVVRFGTKT